MNIDTLVLKSLSGLRTTPKLGPKHFVVLADPPILFFLELETLPKLGSKLFWQAMEKAPPNWPRPQPPNTNKDTKGQEYLPVIGLTEPVNSCQK